MVFSNGRVVNVVYKFVVNIYHKDDVRDPEMEHVLKILKEKLNIPVENLKFGKTVYLEINAESPESATEFVKKACENLLVNPSLEYYEVNEG